MKALLSSAALFHNPESIAYTQLPKGHRFLTKAESEARRKFPGGLNSDLMGWHERELAFTPGWIGNTAYKTYATKAPLTENDLVIPEGYELLGKDSKVGPDDLLACTRDIHQSQGFVWMEQWWHTDGYSPAGVEQYWENHNPPERFFFITPKKVVNPSPIPAKPSLLFPAGWAVLEGDVVTEPGDQYHHGDSLKLRDDEVSEYLGKTVEEINRLLGKGVYVIRELVKAPVPVVNPEVATLESEVTKLKSTITTLQGNVNDLTRRNGNLLSDLSRANYNLDVLKGKIKSVKDSYQAYCNAVDSL